MTTTDPQINGAAVRALREALGIGQGKMAKDLGITSNFLYRIERGDRGCRIVLLRQIATYLAVSPGVIMLTREDAA